MKLQDIIFEVSETAIAPSLAIPEPQWPSCDKFIFMKLQDTFFEVNKTANGPFLVIPELVPNILGGNQYPHCGKSKTADEHVLAYHATWTCHNEDICPLSRYPEPVPE